MDENPERIIAGEDHWSQWLLEGRYAADAAYRQVAQQMVNRIRDRVLDGACLEPGMTIADIGTGDGLLAFGAIARVGSSLRVFLTDISSNLLLHTERLACELGIANRCTFIAGTAEALHGMNDATMDVVMTRAVLAYVANKAAAIRECHRVLKPGGTLSIAEPIIRDQAMEALALSQSAGILQATEEAGFHELLRRWKAAQYPSTEEEIRRSPIANYSERDLVRLARDVGFTEIHLELHIDVRPSSVTTWKVFLGISPHPLAPPLRTILANQFSQAERSRFEQVMRPLVESGKTIENDTVAYLTARKSG